MDNRPSLSLLLESTDDSQKDSKCFYKFITESSVIEDNNKGSRINDCPLTSSYVTTTLQDDDNVSISQIREDVAKIFTSHEDMKNVMRSSDKELEEENKRLKKRIMELEKKDMKWQGFSKLQVAFRGGLWKELKDYKCQNEIDKKTIAALKEQVYLLRNMKIYLILGEYIEGDNKGE